MSKGIPRGMGTSLIRKLRHDQPRTIAAICAVIIFASIGMYVILMSKAASPMTTFEAERGAKTGAIFVGYDSSASSGSYVTFGNNAGEYYTKEADIFVQPGKIGDCSRSSPCGSINEALAHSFSGAIVELGSGTYPAEKIPDSYKTGTFSSNVIVRGAQNQDIFLAENPTGTPTLWQIYAPRLTFTGLTFSENIYTYWGSDYSTFDNVHVVGSGIWVRNSNFILKNSLLEGGYQCEDPAAACGFDGVQVGGGAAGNGIPSENILIENTTIRDYSQGSDTGYHADCVQLFDTTYVTIRYSRLYNCYNSAFILSGGRNVGMDHILLESNFIAGCLPSAVARCKGGPTIEVRSVIATNVVLRNNTVYGSYLHAENAPIAENNIFRWVSNCIPDGNNNLIVSWNKGLCGEFPLGPGSKVMEMPAFVDTDNADFHLLNPTGEVRFGTKSGTPQADIDGDDWCPTPNVGADETACN